MSQVHQGHYDVQTRFFYFRDRDYRPLVTVCRLSIDEPGIDGMHHIDAYGWSVCSRKDNPCKATGRAIAAGRAWSSARHRCYAWTHESVSSHVPTFLFRKLFAERTEALHVVRDCWAYRTARRLPSTPTLAQHALALLPLSMHPRLLSSCPAVIENVAATHESIS